MGDAPLDRAQGGTPLWVRIVLALSLAVNLLVAGVVLGAVLGDRDRGGPGDRASRDPGALPFVRALEPDERRMLLRRFQREGGPAFRPDRDEMRARMETLMTILRAESFDRAALESVLGAQAAEGAARQAMGQQLLLDHLEGLAPEARRAYADRLEEALSRGARR